jgi:hypothetical protein
MSTEASVTFQDRQYKFRCILALTWVLYGLNEQSQAKEIFSHETESIPIVEDFWFAP